MPVLAALLVEASFYIGTVLELPRNRFEQALSAPVRAAVLAVSAVLPYLLYTVPLGLAQPGNLLLLLAIGGLIAAWFVVFPFRGGFAAVLLVAMAAILLSKIFTGIYPRPYERVRVDILGQLMLFRLGIMAFLSFGKQDGIRLGFLPERREWVVGLRWFLLFAPLAGLVNVFIGFARFAPPPLPWWQLALLAVGTFAAFLWVIALCEEFFFRGVLQQWLARGFGNDMAGLIAASLLFGSVHLWFRQFPNYRFALLAAIAGVFYGLAFREGRGIRAAMVTHALVVAAWRTLFS